MTIHDRLEAGEQRGVRESGVAGMRGRENENSEEDQRPRYKIARGRKERKKEPKKEGRIHERRTSLVPVLVLVLAVGAARDDVWEHREGHECEGHPGEVCGS
jgi:hypothetical protein